MYWQHSLCMSALKKVYKRRGNRLAVVCRQGRLLRVGVVAVLSYSYSYPYAVYFYFTSLLTDARRGAILNRAKGKCVSCARS